MTVKDVKLALITFLDVCFSKSKGRSTNYSMKGVYIVGHNAQLYDRNVCGRYIQRSIFDYSASLLPVCE